MADRDDDRRHDDAERAGSAEEQTRPAPAGGPAAARAARLTRAPVCTGYG